MGPQYRPQNTKTLFIGTPKKVPLILGNYHLTLWSGVAGLGLRVYVVVMPWLWDLFKDFYMDLCRLL